MVTLEQFKENAKQHGICEMLDDWNNARSKKALMDVALSIRGIEYLARAISEGWGISPSVINDEFKPFLNGRYKRQMDGYSSSIYCRERGDIVIDTTATLIIDFTGVIVVPSNMVCEIYLCNSGVEIVGEGKAKIYTYKSFVVTDISENKNFYEETVIW